MNTKLLSMAHCNLHLVAIAAAVFLAVVGTEASGVGFNLHHRFSPVVRQWMEARGHAPGSGWFPDEAPVEGSREYYAALLRHDRALFARRALADAAAGQITFADGNATRRLDAYLHYAEVEVGTPSSKFLVALDTGSNLFWLPCECKLCAATGNAAAARQYSPGRSSTSKTVPCGHPLCDPPADAAADACAAGGGGSCPYEVRYLGVLPNTRSSGVLVEDVLHLTREAQSGAAGGEAVPAPIVFGCSQVQTGDFRDSGGLMGLGMGKVSVPSALATSGLVASDSFSMCFGRDGVGRINFGDAGGPDQAETTFVAGSLQTIYNITVAAIGVDSKVATPVEFTVVVDSGSTFSYLSDPAYTLLTTSFDSKVKEARANYGIGYEKFEYCYSLSPGQTNLRRLPEVSLTTKGGALFPITWPIFPVMGSTNGGPDHPIGYCLGVLKNDMSTDVDTIGQNFMTGLKVVFDRRRSVLGWEKFDCYKDAMMQDGGSPDISLGSPDESSPAPAGSPGYVPLAPLPWGNNFTDGWVPMPWPRPGFYVPSRSSSRGVEAGGLSLVLVLSVLVLAVTSMAW